MRYIIFLLAICLMGNHLVAQTKKKKKEPITSYAITVKGETLWGRIYEIPDLMGPHYISKIVIRDSLDKKTTYTADEIKLVHSHGTIAETFFIGKKKQKVFLYRAVAGKVNCYYTSKSSMTFGPNGAAHAGKTKYTYYLATAGEDTAIIVDKKTFAQTMKKIFPNCDALYEKLKTEKIKPSQYHKYAQLITGYYNEKCGN